MNVISYFNKIPDFAFSLQSQQLIDIWKKSWQNHRWNTILLDESYAKSNPLCNKLDLDNLGANFYRLLPNHSMWKYHRSCYYRLLAYCQYVRENGTTLYADYDVINYRFSPDVLDSTPEDSYFCNSRCVVYLSINGANEIEKTLLDFNNSLSLEKYNKEELLNDMVLINEYTHCFLLKRDRNDQFYVSSIKSDFSNETPLIHFDGGCYKRGVDRSLSRLDVVKRYEERHFNL